MVALASPSTREGRTLRPAARVVVTNASGPGLRIERRVAEAITLLLVHRVGDAPGGRRRRQRRYRHRVRWEGLACPGGFQPRYIEVSFRGSAGRSVALCRVRRRPQ